MRQQGATLIQLLMAIALLSVLTQLAAQAYTHIRDDLRQAATARELAQALRYARNRAALLEQPVQVKAIDDDWSRGWRVLGAEGELLRKHRPGQPVQIVSNGGSEVRFGALGVPLGRGDAWYGATLHICQQRRAGSRHEVVIARMGRISLRTSAQPGPGCAVLP